MKRKTTTNTQYKTVGVKWFAKLDSPLTNHTVGTQCKLNFASHIDAFMNS